VGAATTIDVTPVDALETGGRLVPWRRQGFKRALAVVGAGAATDGLHLARVG
jgi:hypothetical protein